MHVAVNATNAGAGANGDNVVVPAPSVGWIVLLGYQLMASAAANVKFQSDVTGGSPANVTGPFPMAANGGICAPPVPINSEPYAVLPPGKSLVLNVSAGLVAGAVQYAIRGA